MQVRSLIAAFNACLLGAALSAPTAHAADAAAAPAAFHWPHGERAAVSLSYDDALDSQLDHAIPALDRAGIKATFYLQLSNPAVRNRMAEWRAAATHGHELGNHTLFHQCSKRVPGHDFVQPERNVDTTTVAQMRDQILLGNTMLTALDGRTERTFTVPCTDHMALDGDYLPASASSFVGIKAREGDAVTDSMATVDPRFVTVMAPVGLSGAQLIDIVKRASARGTMVNFTFHGVGGDYLTTSNAAHEELLAFLAAHRAEYWTDTFLNITRYVTTQQTAAKAH
jgi:peptidoglycan/xylan/chitin deacetylase (PgdA/CDA1 family)